MSSNRSVCIVTRTMLWQIRNPSVKPNRVRLRTLMPSKTKSGRGESVGWRVSSRRRKITISNGSRLLKEVTMCSLTLLSWSLVSPSSRSVTTTTWITRGLSVPTLRSICSASLSINGKWTKMKQLLEAHSKIEIHYMTNWRWQSKYLSK